MGLWFLSFENVLLGVGHSVAVWQVKNGSYPQETDGQEKQWTEPLLEGNSFVAWCFCTQEYKQK